MVHSYPCASVVKRLGPFCFCRIEVQSFRPKTRRRAAFQNLKRPLVCTRHLRSFSRASRLRVTPIAANTFPLRKNRCRGAGAIRMGAPASGMVAELAVLTPPDEDPGTGNLNRHSAPRRNNPCPFFAGTKRRIFRAGPRQKSVFNRSHLWLNRPGSALFFPR